jgi:hypothetical protein
VRGDAFASSNLRIVTWCRRSKRSVAGTSGASSACSVIRVTSRSKSATNKASLESKWWKTRPLATWARAAMAFVDAAS